MYKYLLCFFIVLYSLTLSAQNNYADFSVNNKYGVVNIFTLEELIGPTYAKEVIFSDQYIGFENDNQVYFYDKASAKMVHFITGQEGYHIYLNEKELLHIIQDNKSALLDNKMEIEKVFQERYNRLNYFYGTSYLIALGKKGYDILDISQSYKLVYKHINAKDYFLYDFYYDGQTLENCIVFYGDKTVNLYNNKFQLLKSITAHANTEDDAIAILNPDYLGSKEVESAPVADITGGWYLVRKENDSKIYESQSYSTIYIKVKDKFDIQNYWFNDIKVYSTQTAEIYTFGLDRTYRKALIPLKYQQLMGLEIIDRK